MAQLHSLNQHSTHSVLDVSNLWHYSGAAHEVQIGEMREFKLFLLHTLLILVMKIQYEKMNVQFWLHIII